MSHLNKRDLISDCIDRHNEHQHSDLPRIVKKIKTR